MYKIIISKFANEDIQNIHKYIADDNIKNADKVIDEIYNIFNNLVLFPEIGMIFDGNIRKIVSPKYSYTVYYKLDYDKKLINIININKFRNLFFK